MRTINIKPQAKGGISLKSDVYRPIFNYLPTGTQFVPP